MDDDQGYDPRKFARAGGEAADDAPLPGLNTPYKASGTVLRAVPRLIAIMGKDGFRPGSTSHYALQYVHLGSGEFGGTANGQAFNYVFADVQPKLLTVQGRNLLEMFDHIALHRMPWIRMTDRDFTLVGASADEPVITRLSVSIWKRPPAEQAAALEEAMAEELA